MAGRSNHARSWRCRPPGRTSPRSKVSRPQACSILCRQAFAKSTACSALSCATTERIRHGNIYRGIDLDAEHKLLHQVPFFFPGKMLFETRAQGLKQLARFE